MTKGILIAIFGMMLMVIGAVLGDPATASLFGAADGAATQLASNLGALGLMFGGLALFVIGILRALFGTLRAILLLARAPFGGKSASPPEAG